MGEPIKPSQDASRKETREDPPEPIKASPLSPPLHSGNSSVPSFLRQLLPKEFDTGDLLIVLLLLLMAGDCEEEHNHALLTLALYFFM